MVDRSGAQGRRRRGCCSRWRRPGTGIYRYDFRKDALDWAHNLANVFGFGPGEELQSLERLVGAIHPDDLPAVLEHYERSRTEGADFDHEFRIVRPDASVRWISDRARMSFDADGTPRFLTGACIDVTARHDSLSREQVARINAERAIRTRDECLPWSRTTCATPATPS